MKFSEGDKIIRKDGSWGKKRFATFIGVNEDDGEMVARFGTAGKYFFAPIKNYIRYMVKGGDNGNTNNS